MANYYRVSPKFWPWARRRGLTDAQTALAFYLLTCEHRNLEGLYRLPKLYISADLGWQPKKVDENLAAVLATGFAQYDEDAEMLLIPKALKHQAPTTEKQIAGAIAQIERIPRSCLWNAFRMACVSHCPRLADAIEARWPSDPDAIPVSRAGASSSSSSSSSSTEAATPQGARAQEATSRSQAETIACPRCKAPAGEKCDGVRGKRESCHLERHHAVGELTHVQPKRRRGTSPPPPVSSQAIAAALEREAKERAFCAHFPGVPAFAVKNVINELNRQGETATIEAVRARLDVAA